MNKQKLLMTFNKMGKESISNIDFILWIGSLIFGAIALDFDLNYLKAVSGAIFMLESSWMFCSFLCLIITEIIIRKRNRKSNIEKLIDEGSGKENIK